MEQSPFWVADRSSGMKKSPALMEPEGSLPHSWEVATCPSAEPDQSSQCPSLHFLKIHFNIILPSTPISSTELTVVNLI